jgi:hypothetical protein
VDIYKIPIGMALGTVAGVLVVSVIASLLFPPKPEATPTKPDPHPASDH